MRTATLLALVIATSAACGGSAPPPARPAAVAADRVLVNVDAEGVGLGGHDPIAYVTANAATPGSPAQTARHGGAVYRFVSAEHHATFEADRAKHAPAYGGYCAFAASQNRLSPSDPTTFLVLDGQLLVFTNPDFLAQFNLDPAGNKQKADANWPGLVAKHGTPAAP
ncbi:MAG: tat pathway signal sequence domain protein [Myxococcota bacterium]|nr:tat pathway signal sequence domain protein [Myxococcota bacterium]